MKVLRVSALSHAWYKSAKKDAAQTLKYRYTINRRLLIFKEAVPKVVCDIIKTIQTAIYLILSIVRLAQYKNHVLYLHSIQWTLNARRYKDNTAQTYMVLYMVANSETSQQNNTRPHIARINIDVLQQHTIDVHIKPALSPDLFPSIIVVLAG